MSKGKRLSIGILTFVLIFSASAAWAGKYIRYYGGTDNYFGIEGSDRLSIGMSTVPGYKLAVVDTGTVPMINIWNNSVTSQWTGVRLARGGITNGTEKWFIGMNADNDNLYFRRGNTANDMYIDTTGDVYMANDATITGKLTVTTIDPVFSINGKKYATYGSDTAGGVKTEVFGKIKVDRPSPDGQGDYQTVLDFSAQPEGSDLWLFEKTTDWGEKMENLVAILTPEGRGNASVSYALDPAGKNLIIYSNAPTTVSYHLIAPRIDHAKWSNVAESGSAAGIDVSDYGK